MQNCIADVKYNGKFSPIIAIKEAPKMVLTAIVATPLALCPIINLFAIMSAENSVSSGEYMAKVYEKNVFQQNAQEEIDKIKKMPILKKLNYSTYAMEKFTDYKDFTYQNYEYKIKIANLIYEKYSLEKQTELDRDFKACVENALEYTDEETYPAFEYLIEKDLFCKPQYRYIGTNPAKRNDLLKGYYEEYYELQNSEEFLGFSESDYMLFRRNGFSIDEIKEFITYKNQYENNQILKTFAKKYIEMKKENLSQEKIDKKINKLLLKKEKKIAKQQKKGPKKSFDDMPDCIVHTGIYFAGPFYIYKAIGQAYIEEVKFETYKSKRKKELKSKKLKTNVQQQSPLLF